MQFTGVSLSESEAAAPASMRTRSAFASILGQTPAWTTVKPAADKRPRSQFEREVSGRLAGILLEGNDASRASIHWISGSYIALPFSGKDVGPGSRLSIGNFPSALLSVLWALGEPIMGPGVDIRVSEREALPKGWPVKTSTTLALTAAYWGSAWPGSRRGISDGCAAILICNHDARKQLSEQTNFAESELKHHWLTSPCGAKVLWGRGRAP